MTGAIVARANLVSPRLLPLGFAPDKLHMNNGIDNIVQLQILMPFTCMAHI